MSEQSIDRNEAVKPHEYLLYEKMVGKPQRIAAIIQISSLGITVLGVFGLLFFNIISDRMRFFKDIRYFKMITIPASIISIWALFSIYLGINCLMCRWMGKKKEEFENTRVHTMNVKVFENE